MPAQTCEYVSRRIRDCGGRASALECDLPEECDACQEFCFRTYDGTDEEAFRSLLDGAGVPEATADSWWEQWEDL